MPTFQNGLTGEVKEVSLEDAAWFDENPPWYRVQKPAPMPESAKGVSGVLPTTMPEPEIKVPPKKKV